MDKKRMRTAFLSATFVRDMMGTGWCIVIISSSSLRLETLLLASLYLVCGTVLYSTFDAPKKFSNFLPR